MQKAILFVAFVTAAVTIAAPASAADKNGDFFARGLGSQRCQHYVAEKAKGSATYFLYRSWLNGYMSAFNQYAEDNYDVAPNATMIGLANAVEAVCKQNPKQQFWTAAFGLTQALWKGRLPLKSEVIAATAGQQSVRLYRATLQEVQAALNKQGYKVGKPDGIFGKKTQEALADFQKKQKLQVTGLPDPATRAKLLR